jgi:catechol 2,3-dioxygenase-like lactoylglutathione lyase family enzyme
MNERITGDAEVPARAANCTMGQAHPMLAVADIDAAIEHYRSVLGFFLEWARYDEDGPGGIANLWRGELSLFVMTTEGFGPSRVYCHLASRRKVDELHADLVAHGAHIRSAPAPRAWGNYEMAFADLDGNEFRIACGLDEEAG